MTLHLERERQWLWELSQCSTAPDSLACSSRWCKAAHKPHVSALSQVYGSFTLPAQRNAAGEHQPLWSQTIEEILIIELTWCQAIRCCFKHRRKHLARSLCPASSNTGCVSEESKLDSCIYAENKTSSPHGAALSSQLQKLHHWAPCHNKREIKAQTTEPPRQHGDAPAGTHRMAGGGFWRTSEAVTARAWCWVHPTSIVRMKREHHPSLGTLPLQLMTSRTVSINSVSKAQFRGRSLM